MKTMSIVIMLLSMLILFSAHNGQPIVTSSSMNMTGKPAAQVSSPGGPVSWIPFRDAFTVTEEEPFLIAIGVDCPSRAPTGHEFELLSPTPAFVRLSPACVATDEARALAIVQVSPQVGNAGKYQIKVRATPCYGSLGSEITFKLKVKKLQRQEGQLQRPGDSIEQQVLLPHPKSNLGVVGNMAFVVHKVEPGTPAEQIGLRQGDLITEWNGKQIISIRDFLMMEQLDPGQPVEVTFLRADFAKGKYQTLKGAAPLAAFPSESGSK